MLTSLLCLLLSASPAPALALKAGGASPGEEVSLDVSGLLAPADARTGLFLFGRLGSPARSVRALLLRSTDGGAHWVEVLPTVEGSEVLDVHFTGCQGRALVGWTTEGPGELSLYVSSDCGASWRRRSTLPKAAHTEWLHALEWRDARHGTVWLSDTADEASPPRALSTRDSGRTWAPVAHAPAPTRPAAPPRREALTPSGVRWELTPDAERTALRLIRRAPGASPRARALLPLRWRVSGSRLVPQD